MMYVSHSKLCPSVLVVTVDDETKRNRLITDMCIPWMCKLEVIESNPLMCRHFLFHFRLMSLEKIHTTLPSKCFQTKPIKRIMQIVWKCAPLTVWTATDNQTIAFWSLVLLWVSSWSSAIVHWLSLCLGAFLETDRYDSDSDSVCFGGSSRLS